MDGRMDEIIQSNLLSHKKKRDTQRETVTLLHACDALNCLYFKSNADYECTLVLMKSLVFRERNQEAAAAA